LGNPALKMKEIYRKIWKLAKPYYRKGRACDINHVEWMMKEAFKLCQKENIDGTLLLPLVILHDIGYAEAPKDNPFKRYIRIAHMSAGKRFARKILKQVGYAEDKIIKIAHYVSVHDNWALGDNEIFRKDIILGVFNDLDFAWIATRRGFHALQIILGKGPDDTLEWIENNDKPRRRPFALRATKKLFEDNLKAREEEIKRRRIKISD
jgi:hypothetical protein